jgi:protein-arginine kinase activator protein McsA
MKIFAYYCPKCEGARECHEVIKKCSLCGATYNTSDSRGRICPECVAATRHGKVYRPRKHEGNLTSGAIYEGDGWNQKSKSAHNINVVLKEARPEKGESPFSYGKIMARLSKE